MTEKVVGYALLVIGILIMVLASMHAISVFTGKSKPAQIFTPKISVQKPATTPLSQEEINEAVQSGDFASILSSGMANGMDGFGINPSMITDSLNFTVYFFLIQFILGLGFKVSSLGVQMVRAINVIVRKNPLVGMEEK